MSNKINTYPLQVEGNEWGSKRPLTLDFLRVSGSSDGHALITEHTVVNDGDGQLVVKIEGDPVGDCDIVPNRWKSAGVSDEEWAIIWRNHMIAEVGDKIAKTFFTDSEFVKPTNSIEMDKDDYKIVKSVEFRMSGTPNDHIYWGFVPNS